MTSLLQCLLPCCSFEETPEESPNESYEPPRSNRISRLFQSTDPDVESGAYSPARFDDSPESDEESEDCWQNDTATAQSAGPIDNSNMSRSNPHVAGLRHFWQTLKERFNLEDSDATSTSPSGNDNERECRPILTQASSFDSSKEVLTIQTEQVVIPGSDLQHQMAKAMAGKLEEHDDECVICMEGFDPTNPRMPTLCGCGENKTYFHLPCLYQWIEQSRNCPSCRETLQWEEF